MRILMQMTGGDAQSSRYYQLILQQDLLEGWTFVKEWGSMGRGSRLERYHYLTLDDAERALAAARDSLSKRGYRVVFAQGQLGSL